MKIGALVLAGGQSRRFGSDKRQAILPNGKLVIQQTLEKVTAVFDDVVVVLRSEDPELREKLEALFHNVSYCHAPDSNLGMGHTLSFGVSQIDGWDGVFVFLADMPFVEVKTLKSLIPTGVAAGDEAEGSLHSGLRPAVEMRSSIIVPSYQNKPGHPVGFGADFFAELAEVEGDRGAKVVINQHQDAILVVTVEDPGVLADVDQPADI